MRNWIARRKKPIIIVLLLLLYVTFLTWVSLVRAPAELRGTGESLIKPADFTINAPEGKAWADDTGLYFNDTAGSEKVFTLPFSLRDLQQLQVTFTVECPADLTGFPILHIDLCSDGYDTDEQEFFIALQPGRNEVSQFINKGANAPDEAQFRIFCLDAVQCGIHDLSVRKAEPVSRAGAKCSCAVLLAVLLCALAAVVSLRGEKTGAWKSVPADTATLRETLLPAGLLALTFGVVGPIQMYLTNATEFWFGIGDIWWICLLAGTLILAVCLLIGGLLPRKWLPNFHCLLIGLALGLYIQGNYIPTSYSTIDGTIDWSQYSGVAVWNTLVWVVCLILPFLLRKMVPGFWKSCRKVLPVAIIAVQILTLGMLFLTTDLSRDVDVNLTNKGKLELSAKHNIITFVLDAYDSQYFIDFIENNPEYKETLWKDFTFYPDTVCGAARTVIAMPEILTGIFHTKENGYNEYLDEAYQMTKLYRSLQQANYNIGLYTSGEYVRPQLEDLVLNLETTGKKVKSYPTLAQYLYRFTACRYFPHVLKSSVWTYTGDFDKAADQSGSEDTAYLWNDPLFYQTLLDDGISIQDEENTFRLYHLVGAHGPYTLNRQCEYDSQGTSLEEQQKGVMTLLDTFFAQMKQLGIYDEADIVILADHGEIAYSQNPLLLIKHGTQTKTYTVSDVPVSYANLQDTYLSFFGERPENGKSILELTKEDNATRYFYRQEEDVAAEYIVQGKAADPASIQSTGNAFQIFQAKTDETKKYKLGTTVYFDIRGTGQQYIVEGFSKTETELMWTDGEQAVLRFPLKKSVKSDLFVTISATVHGGRQRVGVFVNDTPLNYYLCDANELKFTIPKDLIQSKELTIRLELPDAHSAPADSRLLALAFHNMLISEKQEDDTDTAVLNITYQLGENINFTPESNGCSYFSYGISVVETDFAWSFGTTGRMKIHVGDCTEDLTGEFRFKTLYAPPQRLLIRCAEELLFDKEITSEEEPVYFVVPKECVQDGWLTLDLEYPDAVSPSSRGESDDYRKLAFAFQSICFTN